MRHKKDNKGEKLRRVLRFIVERVGCKIPGGMLEITEGNWREVGARTLDLLFYMD